MKDFVVWLDKMVTNCAKCGNEFYKASPKHRFCSNSCASKARYAEKKRLAELGRQVEQKE